MNEKSIIDELNEVLLSLTPDQLRFVVGMQSHTKKNACADELEISRGAVYNWSKSGKVDRAIELMRLNVIEAALVIRQRNLVKAMAVKTKGLESDNEIVRQKVATEVIEWEIGKATQKTELSVEGKMSWAQFVESDENTEASSE